MDTTIVNWEQLALVVGGEDEPGDDEMKDLYRLFIDDAGERMRRLGALAQPANREAVAKEAHKIRGAAASFGFDHVAAILQRVEVGIETLTEDQIQASLGEALAVFECSVRGVAERYPGLAA